MRSLAERPLSGLYPIISGAAGWVAPPSRSFAGRGPVQYLGAFDTRPELPEWEAAAVRTLRPIPAPGGVTLRWSMPHMYGLGGSSSSWLASWPRAGVALVLYVASFDVLPPAGWASGAELSTGYAWPGLPPSAYEADPQQFQELLGLQFSRVATRPYAEESDGAAYLTKHAVQPALELLSYTGRPWSEADLAELGGGARYVAAWLRLWWVRDGGTDPLGTVNYQVPWTLTAGRAVDAEHRRIHHCAYMLRTTDVLAASRWDAVNARYAVPVRGGLASIAAASNAELTDTDAVIGVEGRGAVPMSRESLTVPSVPGSVGNVAITTRAGHVNLLPQFDGGTGGQVVMVHVASGASS